MKKLQNSRVLNSQGFWGGKNIDFRDLTILILAILKKP